MHKLATVTNIERLVARAKAAAPERVEDSGFVQRQAEVRRAENLRRAEPDIPEGDVLAIRFARLKPYKPLLAVQRWWSNSDLPFLCLGGSKGNGKTVAGCWAIAEAGGIHVAAFELPRIAADFRQSDRFDAITRCRVLLLDDLATEKCAPTEMEALLLHIVNRRQARGRRTIFTTNQTRAQLRSRYPDERMWSRLDRAWAYVRCDGRDLRQEGDR